MVIYPKDDYLIERLEVECDKEEMIAEEAIREATSGGDARCNFCDGQMPCHCTSDEEIDYEADAEARNRVDLPWESWPD